MSNLLNMITSNRNITKPQQDNTVSFTFDTNGKIKPLQDKAVLLPSRIFGSPIEYVKDLKQDVVNIGRAAVGKSNDHELGRINDLALKLGSLGIASYLFIKNPLKLSKTMEFVGMGTFFAGMSLWPKLAIQLPLKLRTGVDFRQQYIDSQGRKKMLYQDPQYVLTDLLPREDLDNIGRKMGISENLPDRDSFIKQRAHKTATQANTLWMMTAGLATPLISFLLSNLSEKALKPIIQHFELKNTKEEFSSINVKSESVKETKEAATKEFADFISENKDKAMNEDMIETVVSKFDPLLDASQTAGLKKVLEQRCAEMSVEDLSMDLIKKAFGEDVIEKLDTKRYKKIENIIFNEKFAKMPIEDKIVQISQILSKPLGLHEDEVKKTIELAKMPTVGDAKAGLVRFFDRFSEFSRKKSALDKFLDARTGDRAGSYLANTWEKFCNEFIDDLKVDGPFSTRNLRRLSEGDTDLIAERLNKLVASDNFDKVIKRLMKIIDDFDVKTEEDILKHLGTDGNPRAQEIFKTMSEELASLDAIELVKKLWVEKDDAAVRDTMHNAIYKDAELKVIGERASFYRVIQALDIFKQAQNGTLAEKFTEALMKNRIECTDSKIAELIQKTKDFIISATTTDNIENLMTRGFEVTQTDDYKMIMEVLKDSADSAVIKAIEGQNLKEAGRMVSHLREYIAKFNEYISNWENSITPEGSRRVVDTATHSANMALKNAIVGQNVKNLAADVAKSKYNSKVWMLMFGGAMAALTAITLTAGLMLGRKGKIEQQAEEESKKNV